MYPDFDGNDMNVVCGADTFKYNYYIGKCLWSVCEVFVRCLWSEVFVMCLWGVLRCLWSVCEVFVRCLWGVCEVFMTYLWGVCSWFVRTRIYLNSTTITYKRPLWRRSLRIYLTKFAGPDTGGVTYPSPVPLVGKPGEQIYLRSQKPNKNYKQFLKSTAKHCTDTSRAYTSQRPHKHLTTISQAPHKQSWKSQEHKYS